MFDTKILNFGSCNIDCVYNVEHMVNSGETIASKSLNMYAGGKGLNQSIAVSRAGAEIYHAGCIGTDGEMLGELMRSCGINLKYLRVTDTKTGHAIIQVDDKGENSIVLYHGANMTVTRDYIDSVLADFNSGDFLILQNEISEVPYLIDTAYKKGMRTVLNPSPFDESLKKLDLNKISYLILNEIEAEGFSGLSDTESFIRWAGSNFPRLKVILTLGSKGSIYYDGQNRIYQPAFCVEAVDTTAAGDTFTGYFIAFTAAGETVERVLKYASAAAALAVSVKGAAPSIPAADQVKAALSALKFRVLDGNVSKKIRVCEYFDTHLDNATLLGLASKLGYSPSYMSRWLSENMKTNFSTLLIDKRCERLAEILENEDIPIADAIERIGYKNESFIRRAFIKKYGCTPFEYRKSKKIKYQNKNYDGGIQYDH